MVLWNFIGVYLEFNKNIMTVKGIAKVAISISSEMTSIKYNSKNTIKYFKNMWKYIAMNLELCSFLRYFTLKSQVSSVKLWR